MILANTIGDHYETHLCCIGFAIDACKLASAAAWRMASAASISKVIPPIPITGILGVFCPKEAFLNHL